MICELLLREFIYVNVTDLPLGQSCLRKGFRKALNV